MSSADDTEDTSDNAFDCVDNPQPLREDALLISARRCALALKYLEFLSRSWDPTHRRFGTVIPEHNLVEFNLARAEEVLKRLQLWAPDGMAPTRDSNNPWWKGLHNLNLPFRLLAALFDRNQHPNRMPHTIRLDISPFFDPLLWQSADKNNLIATPDAEFRAKCVRKFFQGFVERGLIRPQHLF